MTYNIYNSKGGAYNDDNKLGLLYYEKVELNPLPGTVEVRMTSSTSNPAIEAEMKVVVDPAIMALKAMEARSDFRSGTMVPSAAKVMPIEAKLLNPHNAYVEMVCDRSVRTLSDFMSASPLYATNSLTSVLSPISLATLSQSVHSTPIMSEMGMKSLDRSHSKEMKCKSTFDPNHMKIVSMN